MGWNEVLTELSKPVWWVSVVIAGIVINLLSAYLKPPLDTVLSTTTSWWRRRSEVRRRLWETHLARITSSDKVMQMAIVAEFRCRLQAIYLLLLGMSVMLFQLFMPDLLPPLLIYKLYIAPLLALVILAISLTVRSFWKLISKNWNFSFEEQRTSNADSISLWATARFGRKRPLNTIRKAGKFSKRRKYNVL